MHRRGFCDRFVSFTLATSTLRQGTKLPHGLLLPGLSRSVLEEKQHGAWEGIEMGKSKTTKFKRPQFNTAGFPTSAVKEADAKGEEHDDEDDGCPAAELLEKVGAQSNPVISLEWPRLT